jgi:hypothetical protein
MQGYKQVPLELASPVSQPSTLSSTFQLSLDAVLRHGEAGHILFYFIMDDLTNLEMLGVRNQARLIGWPCVLQAGKVR